MKSKSILYIGNDNKRPNAMQHNYMKKLVKLCKRRNIQPGLKHVHIYHDEWCQIYKGGYCNCDPDVKIEY